MRPGLVFADDGPRFEGPCGYRGSGDRVRHGRRRFRRVEPRRSPRLEQVEPRAAVEAHRCVSADTIAKVLFTSGSTGPSEGRHQHAADAVLEPRTDPDRAAVPGRSSRRCSATGCRGITRSAAITTSASRSTTAARCTSTMAGRRRGDRNDDRQSARRRHVAAGPVLRPADRPAGLVEHDDEAGQVLVLAAEAVRHPRPQRRVPGQQPAGVHHEQGRAVDGRLGVHAVHERDVVDALADVREQVADRACRTGRTA